MVDKTVWLAALLVLVLSGCTSEPPAAKEEPPVDEALDLWDPMLPVDHSASKCTEAVGIILVDHAAVVEHLPAHFTSADAQALLDAPVPTGQAAVVVAVYECQQHAWDNNTTLWGGEIDILVEEPEIEGTHAPADLHFYNVVQHTNQPALATYFDAVGWAHETSEMSFERSTVGPIIALSAESRPDDGVGHQFGVVARVSMDLAGTNRFWHMVPAGFGYADFTVDTSALTGTVDCTFSEGSVLHEMMGPDCGEHIGMGAIVTDVSWDASMRVVPYDHATT